MSIPHRLRPLTLAAGLLVPASALAGNLASITVSPSPANAGATVTAQVTSTGSACGLHILWGDGEKTPRFVVNGSKTRTHVYTQPGIYQIQATGKPKNGKPACNGQATTSLTVNGGGGTLEFHGLLQETPIEIPKPGGGVGGAKGFTQTAKALKALDLIEKVRIRPHGTWAEFEVLTKLPAAVVIEASTHAPSGVKFPAVDSAIFTLQYRISSKTALHNLDPSKDYHFVVKARTESDATSFHRGQFSTAGRNVKVTLTKIHVIDDGDGGTSGKGDFTFRVKAFGDQKVHVTQSIDSGDTWTANRSFSIAAAPAVLPLSLGVTESDGSFTSIEWYDEPFSLETGHGPGENESWTRTIQAANGDYSLVAHFRFDVSYE